MNIKKILITFICTAAVLISCSKNDSIVNDTPEPNGTGVAKVTINVGRVGVLAKSSAISMESLILTFSAMDEETIRDTTTLTGGSSGEAVEKNITIAAFRDWTMNAVTYDENDSVIHTGSTSFSSGNGDTVDVSLNLKADYSMFNVTFNSIPDSVNSVSLEIDNTIQVDSVLPSTGRPTDVTLAYDYISATESGVAHTVTLKVRGTFWGYDTVLYQADTTLTAMSGNDQTHSVLLSWVGPSDPPDGVISVTVNIGGSGTVTVNAPFEPDVPTDGLVAYYPFFGSAMDLSGNGNNGTVNGATLTTDRFGNANWAYSFNGVDDYIQLNGNFPTLDEFALTAWFTIDSSRTGYRAVVNTPAGTILYNPELDTMIVYIYVDRNGTASKPGQGYRHKFKGNFEKNKWYHIAYNGYSDNAQRIFINASELSLTTSILDGTIGGIYNTYEVGIKYDHTTPGPESFHGGKVDDYRIYNRALNTSEIQALYNEGGWSGNYGMVAYYPFNGDANDKSSNSNDGTVNGATLTTDRFGNANSAYSFDGVDDWIDEIGTGTGLFGLFDNPHADYGQGFALWIKTDSIFQQTFLNYSRTDLGYEQYMDFGLTSSGNVRIYFTASSGGGTGETLTTGSITKASWNHIVVNSHTGVPNPRYEIFINGVKQILTGANDGDWGSGIGSTDIVLGKTRTKANASSNLFKGKIDDLYIFEDTITVSEIQSLYTEGGWPKPYFTDSRDGQSYQMVAIGDQMWIAENLNYNTADGVGSWCYDNNTANCDTYGRLYNWNTAMAGSASSDASPSGVQGICPDGWHLPSDAEWKTLEIFAGMSVADADKDNWRGGPIGTKLKGASFGGSDDFGFNGIGSGRYKDGIFYELTTLASFQSATEGDALNAFHRDLSVTTSNIHRFAHLKTDGWSVRCIKN